MQADIFFFAVAIPAVLLTGLSKGGFGAGIGIIGTPLIALAVSPVTAAAILLPVLIVMDAVGLYSWRGHVRWSIVRQMMPGALAGTALGWATAAMVPDGAVRLLVGAIAIIFALLQAFADWQKQKPKPETLVRANFWGALAGYTSFVAHAGGPPFQAYALALQLDKLTFSGTAAVFFAIINLVKVAPYLALGQFTGANLLLSASLIPFAALGVLAGVWLVHRVSQRVFNVTTQIAMLLVGSKLVWDGLATLT